MKSLVAWVYISFCVAWKNLRNTPIQNALVYISFFGAWLFLFIYLFSVFEEVLQRGKFFCNNPKSRHTSLLAIRSVDQQRNNLSAKTVTSLSNGRRWDRQVTGLLPMNGAFHGIEKTRVIKAYNIYVYGIDFSSD